MSVKISQGIITADAIEASVASINTLSVTGEATVTGSLSINGTDVVQSISEQTEALTAHASQVGSSTDPHLTAAEHEKYNKIAALFADMPDDAPDFPSTPVPTEAIPINYFPTHYKNYAMANWPLSVAPKRVYASRVPYAFADSTGTIVNTAHTVENSSNIMGNIASKLWNNEGLVHECSSDTIERPDDYVGKEWAFYWQYGNYVKDSKGVKHLTAIRGLTGAAVTTADGTFSIPEFDYTANIAAFGPIFWFAVKPEEYQKEDGTWMTDDGTQTGNKISQLWIISDSPWNTITSDGITYEGLSDEQKAELTAHGITEADLNVWPSCKVINPDTGEITLRPYWIHSAFAGGYDPGNANSIVSKLNAPQANGIDYKTLNNRIGWEAAHSAGRSCVQAFGMLFDIVKNATKDSQSIHYGMASNNHASGKAAVSITTPSYLFPISSRGAFEVGCTVCLNGYNADGTDALINSAQKFSYTTDYNRQYVRIAEIDKYDLTDPTAEIKSDTGQLCLRIDPATDTAFPATPFVVITTFDEQSTVPMETQYCAYATPGLAIGGETMNGGTAGTGVLGMHDGAVVGSTNISTNGKHPYRVQGTEYLPGGYICAADTVIVRGNGSTTLTIDGNTVNPTTTEMVIMVCPEGTDRLNSTSNTLATWINAGYKPVGVINGAVSSKYIYNENISYDGVCYPTLSGGSSNAVGHGDMLYVTTSEARGYLSGGNLTYGVSAGSAFLSANVGLGTVNWALCARD